MNKVLITGSNGQLGTELKKIFESDGNKKQEDVFYTDVSELDICDYSALKKYAQQHKITHVINCAAYTAVDKAESEQEKAELVNAVAPANLGKLSKDCSVSIIHTSTDFVFDGLKSSPYNEKDSVAPLSVYGKTKLAGEVNLFKEAKGAIIIRTAWLYSEFGHNFAKTILKLAKERPMLNVVCDQVGTPTHAGDLASAIVIILRSSNKDVFTNKEIFHYSNEGVCSWFDFARTIVEMAGLGCDVKPIPTKDYPTPAKRPAYSVLDKSKIKSLFNITIPYWRDSLKTMIERIK